jgi:hypothetical protein
LAQEQEVDLFQEGGPFDRADPRSLISIMPREARATLEETPVAWLLMGEPELRGMVKPDTVLAAIRTAFWLEYDEAQASQTKMTIKGVQARMATQAPSLLIRDAFASTKKLAWVLHPPLIYDALVEESLRAGMGRVQEILALPLYDSDGKLDHKAAELILKATAFLDVRKNGMPSQRIDTTMKSVQVQVTRSDLKKLGSRSLGEIEQRIRELETRRSPVMAGLAEIDGEG